MKLVSLKVENFGKISNLSLDLNEQLNVIYGKNESGKTTLKNFIYGMLYGFLKPGLHKRRSYEDELERYRPWRGEKYCGELVYALDSKQKIMVYRDFDTNEVTIRDAETWVDLTKEFPTYLREPQFAKVHLGIGKEIFRDCLYIKQQNIDAIENPRVLTSRLQSIAATSTEELSLQKALEKIQKALKQIGTERARKTSFLGQSVKNIEQLQQEQEKVLEKHAQLTASIEEMNQLDNKKKKLLDSQQRNHYIITCIELEKTEERIEKLNILKKKNFQEQQKLIALEDYENFPTEERDILIQLNADFASQKKRQSEVEEELKDCQDKLRKIEQKLLTYVHLEGLAGTSTDEISEKRREWIDLENEKKRLKQILKEQNRAFSEMESQKYRHSRFSSLNQKIKEKESELEIAEANCCRSEYYLLCTEVKKIQNTIETVKKLRNKIEKNDHKLQSYEPYANFPSHRKDEILNLQNSLGDANEVIEQLKAELKKQQEKLTGLQDRLKPFSGYEQISENLEQINRLESKNELLLNNESQKKEELTQVQNKIEEQSDKLSLYESKFHSLNQEEFDKLVQDVVEINQNQSIISLKENQIQRLCAEVKQIQDIVETVEKLEETRIEVNQTLSNFENYAGFPVHRKDELINLKARFNDNNERVEQLKERLSKEQKKLNRIKNELEQFSGYEEIEVSLDEINRLESKLELLVDDESRQKQRLAETKNEIGTQSEKLKNFENKFHSLTREDFDRLLRDTMDFEKNQTIISLEERELNKEIEQLNNLKNRVKKGKKQVKISFSASGILTIASLVLFWSFFYLTFILIPLGIGGFVLAFRKSKRIKKDEIECEESTKTLQNKELKLSQRKKELEINVGKVDEILKQVGVNSIDELKIEYANLEELRHEYVQLGKKADEIIHQLEDTQSELRRTQKQLQECIKNTINLTEGDIFEQIAEFQKNYQQYQSLYQQYRIVEKDLNELQSDLKDSEKKANRFDEQINQILMEVDLKTVDQFLQALEKQKIYQEKVRQKSELEDRIQNYLKGKEIGELKLEEKEKEKSIEKHRIEKAELTKKYEKLKVSKGKIDEILKKADSTSIDELKKKYAQYQKLSQELEQLGIKNDETRKQLEDIQNELIKTQRQLQEYIEPAINLTGKNISEQIAKFQKNYQQYQSLYQQYRIVEKEVGRLQSQLKKAEEKTNGLKMQMTQILVRADLKTVEQFLEAVEKQRLYQETVKQKTELEEKLQIHLTGKSLEDLESEKCLKDEQIQSLVGSCPIPAKAGKKDIMIQHAKAEYERFSAKRHEIEQGLQALQTERKTRFSESIQAQEQRIIEKRNELCQAQEQQNILEEKLKDILIKTEMLPADIPFSIKLIDTLLNQLNQYNQLKQEKIKLLKTEGERTEKSKKARARLDEIQTKQQSLLLKANVETFEAYNQAWNKHEQFQTQKKKIQDLIKEQDSHLGEQSFVEWQKQAQKLERETEDLIENNPDLLNLNFAQSDEEKYRKNLKHVKDEIKEVEKKIHGIRERIKTHMVNSRPLYEIEEELEQAILEKQRLEKQKDALALAKEQLETISREFITKRFAPELREIVTPMLKTVTTRYGEMRFDENLNLKVRIPELNLIKEVEVLSQGTLDQIYFLLKSGIAKMLSKNRESLPLLLDDPFVTCDGERLEKILDILGGLAKKTQIFLFTCHRWQVHAIAEHFGYDIKNNILGVGGFALLPIAL